MSTPHADMNSAQQSSMKKYPIMVCMDNLERITLTLWMSKIIPNPSMQITGEQYLLKTAAQNPDGI